MKFELDDEQMAKLKAWSAERDKAQIVRNHAGDNDFAAMVAASGEPYYGAIGGELTFSFTPTSLGDLVVVWHSDGSELDLTGDL